MNIKDIILKKSHGKALSKEEIIFFVNGYTNGEIPDYQISSLLMAIKLKGMNEKETFELTKAMLETGEVLNLSKLGMVVDKHSTGGVSDTTSLVIAPIVASCGVNMLKLSGGGLGHTGGTIDKLGAFDGFNTNISMDEAITLTKKIGCCVLSATANLAPADKKMYALRNATSTVDSIPLIASSVMSKKLAGGADAIVLDVKYGNGAFMKTKKSATELAKLMSDIGRRYGKKIDYVVGDMNEPLGYNIGNTLEAYEAIEILKGKKGKLYDAIIELSGKCIALGLDIEENIATQMAIDAIKTGKALEKFKEMVKAQGGSTKLFNGLKLKPTLIIKATQNGVLKSVNTEELGILVGQMGAAKQTLDDVIDYNVGIKTFHKIGEQIHEGDTLFEVYAKNKGQAKEFAPKLLGCYKIV
ncbi:MAG: thymidine phosphorylase [Clostridia bacterium]|nr:thymidine phosphorylase [Clostridia bacterium]